MDIISRKLEPHGQHKYNVHLTETNFKALSMKMKKTIFVTAFEKKTGQISDTATYVRTYF